MSSCVCWNKKKNLLSKTYILIYIIEFNYLVLSEKIIERENCEKNRKKSILSKIRNFIILKNKFSHLFSFYNSENYN